MNISTNETLSAQQLGAGAPPPKPPQATLSDEQSETVQSILSNYDADSLSEEDAKAIMEQFKEAGIEPSKSLESVMSDAGFDAKQLGEIAGLPEDKPKRPLPSTATFEVTA